MVKTATRRHAARRKAPRSRSLVTSSIAVFKFVKVLLLVGVSLGSLKLLNPATAATADRWANALAWRLGPRAASVLRDGVTGHRASQLKLIGIVAFLYAVLFAVEGVGLWMGRRWAEYLTIIATASLVPFEVYELCRHVSWLRGATLGVNLLIAGYLVWKVRQDAKS